MKPKNRILSRVPRIMVADDQAEARKIISQTHLRANFKVDVAADGEEAWEALLHDQYDLLVTDKDMPGLTGLALIKRVRDAGMRLPIIMTSGSLSGADALNCTPLNITAVLTKPFAFWDFLGIVSMALQDSNETAMAAEGYPGSPTWQLSRETAKPIGSGHDHVLIADDDPTVRGSLAAVLESEGYVVDEASNGIEAVTKAIMHKPALVLLDLNMPHADGWTAFNQLDELDPLLPVIVITARPNQYQEAVRVGVDAFMEKPLNIPMLVSAVKHLTNEAKGCHVNRIADRAVVTQLLGSAVS